MYELMDKGFLMGGCLVLALLYGAEPMLAIPFLMAMFLSAASSFWGRPFVRAGGLCLFILVSLWEPAFLLFAPALLYDVFLTREIWFSLLLIPALILHASVLDIKSIALILLFSATAFLIKTKSVRSARLAESRNSLRDSMAELTLKLENSNRELRLHQDRHAHLVRLGERNRIAREIHDNVGHLLSSAMLQIGALLSLPQAQPLREPLSTLRGTLSEGMAGIRQSVHGLHDDSVDLQEELSALVSGFTFCKVSLEYDVEKSPEGNVKYAFLAIAKEALSNIARHSRATAAIITVREHPALYQLDIRDNGQNARYAPEATGGIGITNMQKRVSDLHGRIRITAEGGFHIFISVPKEGSKCAS